LASPFFIRTPRTPFFQLSSAVNLSTPFPARGKRFFPESSRGSFSGLFSKIASPCSSRCFSHFSGHPILLFSSFYSPWTTKIFPFRRRRPPPHFFFSPLPAPVFPFLPPCQSILVLKTVPTPPLRLPYLLSPLPLPASPFLFGYGPAFPRSLAATEGSPSSAFPIRHSRFRSQFSLYPFYFCDGISI